jgi:hypothetical protein
VALPLNRHTGSYAFGNNNSSYSANYVLPLDITRIEKLTFSYSLSATSHLGTSSGVSFKFHIVSINPSSGSTSMLYSHTNSIMSPAIRTFTNEITVSSLDLPRNSNFYRIDVEMVNVGATGNFPSSSVNTGTFFGAKVDYLSK